MINIFTTAQHNLWWCQTQPQVLNCRYIFIRWNVFCFPCWSVMSSNSSNESVFFRRSLFWCLFVCTFSVFISLQSYISCFCICQHCSEWMDLCELAHLHSKYRLISTGILSKQNYLSLGFKVLCHFVVETAKGTFHPKINTLDCLGLGDIGFGNMCPCSNILEVQLLNFSSDVCSQKPWPGFSR